MGGVGKQQRFGSMVASALLVVVGGGALERVVKEKRSFLFLSVGTALLFVPSLPFLRVLPPP